MLLTRRDAAKLVLTGAGLALAPMPALARSNREWATRLEDRLNGALVSGSGGHFRVAAFGQANPQGNVQMAAVVELTWPPGFRSNRLDAYGNSDDATFATLEADALSLFHRVWPDGVKRTA